MSFKGSVEQLHQHTKTLLFLFNRMIGVVLLLGIIFVSAAIPLAFLIQQPEVHLQLQAFQVSCLEVQEKDHKQDPNWDGMLAGMTFGQTLTQSYPVIGPVFGPVIGAIIGYQLDNKM